jgi:LIVCS family branched-chain amino acid:cation transporter
MAFSCLTTAAAIISMAGDMFLEMTNNKMNYRLTVTLATIIGFTLGLVGLSKIVKYTVPWLVLLYPSIVVLILSALYYNFAKIKNSVTVGVIVALIFGLGDMLSFYGLTSNIITKIASGLPLGGQGLGWVLPTVIIMGIAQLIFKPKIEEEKSL